MSATFFVTPKGEETVVLPRAEFEELSDSVEHAQAMSAYRAGHLPGLVSNEVRELLSSSSPLTFWRKRAGMTQSALASIVGVTQNYLSDIENGKRDGSVHLWLKIARALGVPLDALVEDEGDAAGNCWR